MSLSFWFTTAQATATVYRNTPTADAAGGQVDSWAALGASTTNVAVVLWPKKEHQVVGDLHVRQTHENFEMAFQASWDARPVDKIVVTGGSYAGTYAVEDPAFDFGQPNISIDTPYIVRVTLRKR